MARRCSVLLVGVLGALVAGGPVAGDPSADRILVGQRLESPDPTLWRGLRIGFYEPISPSQEALHLALYALPGAEPGECEMAGQVLAALEPVVTAAVDLDAFPVVPRGSLWIDMPPKNEIWLEWEFDPPIEAQPETIFFALVDVARGDAEAGGAVLDFAHVGSVESASSISLDGGETFACLDLATALRVIGQPVDDVPSPLLRIEIVPVW